MAAETRRTSSRVAGKAVPSASAPAASTKRKAQDPPAAAKKAKANVETDDKKEPKSTDAPSSKTLAKGDALPSITLKDESGKDVSISELKKTVLFTYVLVIHFLSCRVQLTFLTYFLIFASTRYPKASEYPWLMPTQADQIISPCRQIPLAARRKPASSEMNMPNSRKLAFRYMDYLPTVRTRSKTGRR